MMSVKHTHIDIPSLSSLERDDLIGLWMRLLDKPLPTKCSSQLMARVIAAHIQTRRHGGLSRSAKRKIKQAQAALSTAPSTCTDGNTTSDDTREAKSPFAGSARSSTRPTPGTRLLREWNGVTHIVDVDQNGYVWNGQSYRSLSAIARTITGARWSGPRFFGLVAAKTKAIPRSKETKGLAP